MFEPHIHAFSPHISMGYADEKNAQPVFNEIDITDNTSREEFLVRVYEATRGYQPQRLTSEVKQHTIRLRGIAGARESAEQARRLRQETDR